MIRNHKQRCLYINTHVGTSSLCDLWPPACLRLPLLPAPQRFPYHRISSPSPWSRTWSNQPQYMSPVRVHQVRIQTRIQYALTGRKHGQTHTPTQTHLEARVLTDRTAPQWRSRSGSRQSCRGRRGSSSARQTYWCYRQDSQIRPKFRLGFFLLQRTTSRLAVFI